MDKASASYADWLQAFEQPVSEPGIAGSSPAGGSWFYQQVPTLWWFLLVMRLVDLKDSRAWYPSQVRCKQKAMVDRFSMHEKY